LNFEDEREQLFGGRVEVVSLLGYRSCLLLWNILRTFDEFLTVFENLNFYHKTYQQLNF
jgi:hypothetical protein